MAEDKRYTLEEAVALKQRLVDEREADAPREWNAFLLGPHTDVTDFLNRPPAQGPGEAMIIDGTSATGITATYVFIYL